NLALNEPSDQLYFTAANGNIQRAYFDDNVNQNIWRYAELKDKNTNAPIKATGSVAFYRNGVSDKLFYVNGGNIYYAETIDNGITWTNVNNVALATGVNTRIKINGNNIYYIDINSNKIFYKSLINTNSPILVGNTGINYSQDMFAVEDGILAYADQNNNIVAFDALTGAVLPVTIVANLKAVTYNSAIGIYNKNIYYISSSGTLRILQKNTTSTSYTAYQDVASQLAGPFTINRQTGTVYAKAYDVAGKQIYFLNNQWTVTPVKNYLQGSPIQSSMVYGNGHAFYISSNGLLSNTFYIAPCVPNVLRTSGNTNTNNGDPFNDPIPVVREEIPALTLYPNPAKNLVHVNIAVDKASNIQIKMVSLTGSMYTLLSTSVEEGVQDIQLPLEAYAAGTYLVQLYIEGALSASSKLVIY
ncbi:MAG TPA: T9SS type A sorting domain-containing protein, partial [Cytophaga sp.]|nr:T9SS type A sorting domain-containing protein [Cytophaga sp.]